MQIKRTLTMISRYRISQSIATSATTTLLLFASSVGCVSNSYDYGSVNATGTTNVPLSEFAQNPLTIGGEHPRLDRIEQGLQKPRRAIRKLFRSEEPSVVDSEEQRWQAVDLSHEYLSGNGLNDVYIDVREYDPSEQWARLKANERISPIWKYTGGTLSVVGYSLFPQRVFQADDFNPFTNTLSLNSTKPAAAIYAAAEAKQYRKQRFLGTYSVLQRAPIVPFIHHAHVSSDVLSYARVNDRDELERKLYPAAYAGLGAAAVSEVIPLAGGASVPFTVLSKVAGGTVGRATGNAVANRQESHSETGNSDQDEAFE